MLGISRTEREILAPHLAKAGRGFTIVILLGLSGGIASMGQAYCLSYTLGAVLLPASAVSSWKLFLFGFLLSGLIRSLCSWGEELFAAYASTKVVVSLRAKLIGAISARAPYLGQDRPSGEILHTTLSGVDSMDAFVGRYLPQCTLAILVPGAFLLVVFLVDMISGILLLLTAPLIPLFQFLVGQAAAQASQKRWTSLLTLNARFLDMIRGMACWKAFRGSKEGLKVIGTVSEDYRKTTMQTMRIAFLSAFTTELAATMSTAILAVGIGLRLMHGMIELAPALFLLILTPAFFHPLRQLGACYHASLAGRKALEGIQILFQEAENACLSRPVGIPLPVLSEICFQKVDFSYRSNLPVLKGISFTLQKDKMYVLYGSSGSGKTTILHLLLGLIHPLQGKIVIGGTSFAGYSGNQWLSQLAYLPQRPYFFYGTVMDNLRIAKPNAAMEEVQNAIACAGLGDFISDLPDGYQTKLGERGFRLSGGEAQRLALARVFLRDAPLILLDEPSSGLDPELEWLLEKSIQTMRQGRTIIWVTHHLDVAKIADEVLLLVEGKIVAQGAHLALTKGSPEYRNYLAERSRVTI